MDGNPVEVQSWSTRVERNAISPPSGADADSTSRMRVVSIINQKGGCGKTTTAINLAAVLARSGARTLLVDMDPQSHCAAGLGVPESGIEHGVAELLLGDLERPLDLQSHLWEIGTNLHLLPSTVQLAMLEAPYGPLASRLDRDRRLSRLLAWWRESFDWCIVDCPPTIGLLTFNALMASDLVLVPVETGYFSLKGAEKQIQTIGALVERRQQPIPFYLLPTLVDESKPLSRDVLAALSSRFSEHLLPVVVHNHEVLREAASFGQAVTEYAPGSDAEVDFQVLAQWLEAWRIETNDAVEASGQAMLGMPPQPLIEPPMPTHSVDFPSVVQADSALAQVSIDVSGAAIAAGMNVPPPFNRAADLAARLRALAERARNGDARSQAPIPQGFGAQTPAETQSLGASKGEQR